MAARVREASSSALEGRVQRPHGKGKKGGVFEAQTQRKKKMKEERYRESEGAIPSAFSSSEVFVREWQSLQKIPSVGICGEAVSAQ